MPDPRTDAKIARHLHDPDALMLDRARALLFASGLRREKWWLATDDRDDESNYPMTTVAGTAFALGLTRKKIYYGKRTKNWESRTIDAIDYIPATTVELIDDGAHRGKVSFIFNRVADAILSADYGLVSSAIEQIADQALSDFSRNTPPLINGGPSPAGSRSSLHARSVYSSFD